MAGIDDYESIVGSDVIERIKSKAGLLAGKHVLHINATFTGGGVAEILATYIPLMNELGIDTGWRILHGQPDFFAATKKIHNGLQGAPEQLTEEEKEMYISTCQQFSIYTHVKHDCVIIHDPQPLPLIRYCRGDQPWIWRCHIDMSHPNPGLWDLLRPMVQRYDRAVVSAEQYKRSDLTIPQDVVPVAIDPLSRKNCDLSEEEIEECFKEFGIPTDKPLLVQISRFDKWKDPLGVLEVFESVRKEIDCRLVLCGSMASDDPEGQEVYRAVHDQAQEHLATGDVLLVTQQSSTLVNALQRKAAVVIQKSIREGFGLTVSEALWKGTPVLASNVGGIPLQIEDGVSGYLLEPDDVEGFVEKAIFLLRNPDMRSAMGTKGKEHVRNNFLLTALIERDLDLLARVMLKQEILAEQETQQAG